MTRTISFLSLLAVSAALLGTVAAAQETAERPLRHEIVLTGTLPAEAEVTLNAVYSSYTRKSSTITDEGVKWYPKIKEVEIPVKVDRARGTFEAKFSAHESGLFFGKGNLSEARLSVKTATHSEDVLRIYATNSDKSATNGQRYGRLTDLVTLVAERKDQYGSRYIGLSAEFDGESKGASQRLATVPATDGRTEARFDIVLR